MSPDKNSCPVLLIGAIASGQGKTSVTAALARYHRKQGRVVQCFKVGPDFIDPLILERASDRAVYQLDLWMVGERQCAELLSEAAVTADLILIEGVMGLFDGDPSSADLAEHFALPVLAVIDAGAMAQTFGALVQGLAGYRPQLQLSAVVANGVASPHHAQLLQQSLKTPLPLCPFARDPALSLAQRHLGLCLAEELPQLDGVLDALAAQIADSPLANLPAPVDFVAAGANALPLLLAGRTIAIAKDACFAFVYAANLRLLEALGAQLRFFSPLQDAQLPVADALYLPGGYPELHGAALARNQSLSAAVREFVDSGKPVLAECGGMMYLAGLLTDNDGAEHVMADVLPMVIAMQTRLVALGLQQLDTPLGELRGHTFHYSRLEEAPTYIARTHSPQGQAGEGVFVQKKLTASYVHWYFPSNPQLTAVLFTEGLGKLYG